MNQYANDFSRTVEIYYDDLKRYKPITKVKERRLIRLAKKGNLKAKNELLESNLRFVFDTARHYTGRGVPISELISEGNMALLRAIDKFDESKDVKFISYAVWWVRQHMQEIIRKRKLMNLVEIVPTESNDSVMDSKIFDDDVDEANNNQYDISNEDDEETISRMEQQREMIVKLMDQLNDREKDIIKSFYGIDEDKGITLTEIGKKYNLTTERVRQIKLNAIRKLRSKVMLMDDVDDFFA